jgi:autotransporter adhesin
VAVGANAQATGENSAAIGANTVASADYAFALGAGAQATAAGSVAIACVCSTPGMFAMGGKSAIDGSVQQWLTILPDASGFNHVQIPYLPFGAGSGQCGANFPHIAAGDLWIDTTAGANNGVVKQW